MMQHPQSLVAGQTFLADAGIRDLVAYLNNRGITTIYSCQGESNGDGYIGMSDLSTLPAFLTALEELIIDGAHREMLGKVRNMGDTSWKIRVGFLPYRASLAEASIAATDDLLLTDAEIRQVGRSGGWTYNITMPSDDLLRLNDIARNLGADG